VPTIVATVPAKKPTYNEERSPAMSKEIMSMPK